MRNKILRGKSMALLLALVFMLSGVTGCNRNNPPVSSNGTEATTSTNITQTTNAPDATTKEESTMTTTDTTTNVTGGGWIEPTQPSAAEETAVTTEAGTTTPPTQATGAAVQHDFRIKLLQYHPGVPGYDVTYQIMGTYKESPINVDEYSLSCNLPGVRVNGNQVIVPDSVRQTGQMLNVTATYLNNKQYKYRLSITLKPWTKTLDNDFNSIDSNLWESYGTGQIREGNPYNTVAANTSFAKDGKLILEPKKQTAQGKPNVKYADAAISTRDKFYQTYGCFTSKIKMPDKGGILSGFWLMPQGRYRVDDFFTLTNKPTKWLCSEIDIVEHVASWKDYTTTHTEHYWDESAQYLESQYRGYTIPDFKIDQFYEYSCVWTKYALYYYINGELIRVNDNICSVNPIPAYIVYSIYCYPETKLDNVTVDGKTYNYEGWGGFMLDEYYGNTRMEVEFLRVYK